MIKKLFRYKDRSLDNFTLENIQNKMLETGWNEDFTYEIVTIFRERIRKYGEKAFQEWFKELHYQVPEEFDNELLGIEIYDNYATWIEHEVASLEKETNLSWEKQTEDIRKRNDKVRKVQLVIRHRLSEVSLELLS
ncbi:hypothetical protein [Oceanobacillus saliphilus]|uniref:hypothetical protein n=1 Tax=Oceanobacillus saliphilus TaxID=2925834 RepID=UPI00201DFD5F|nr:hypothetical protein [Oceanobacillus saliphilus]